MTPTKKRVCQGPPPIAKKPKYSRLFPVLQVEEVHPATAYHPRASNHQIDIIVNVRAVLLSFLPVDDISRFLQVNHRLYVGNTVVVESLRLYQPGNYHSTISRNCIKCGHFQSYAAGGFMCSGCTLFSLPKARLSYLQGDGSGSA